MGKPFTVVSFPASLETLEFISGCFDGQQLTFNATATDEAFGFFCSVDQWHKQKGDLNQKYEDLHFKILENVYLSFTLFSKIKFL